METFGLICLYGIAAVDDIKTREVRVIEIVIFGMLGIIFNIICRPYSMVSIAGGVGIGLLILIFSLLTRGKIGAGDAYIIMVTGLFLGFINTAILLWVSSILAAIYGICMVRICGRSMRMELPFVPFLLIGYLLLNMMRILGGSIA